MQTRFPYDQRGLTLVEVMIALAVFTVGILAVASLQGIGMNAISSAKKGIYDTVAAGGRLESILSMSYDDPLLIDTDDGYDPDNPDHGPFAIAATGSTIEWEVDDDFPAPSTKRISVTVRRPDRSGVFRTFTYEYVKSKDFS